MKLATKIICRTLGTAGLGLAVYIAKKIGNHFAKVESEKTQASCLEKVYYN